MNQKALTGLSHGAAGIAFALLRLFSVTGDERFRNAAAAACQYESSVFSRIENNWPDFRNRHRPGGPAFACSWCHGAPGIALARLGALNILRNDAVNHDIENGLRKTVEHAAGDLDHLCCGNFGRAEVLLTAGYTLQSSLHRDLATALASNVIRQKQIRGAFSTGWDQGLYLASFHQGMAGIGYELLRISRPDRFPNVLLWN